MPICVSVACAIGSARRRDRPRPSANASGTIVTRLCHYLSVPSILASCTRPRWTSIRPFASTTTTTACPASMPFARCRSRLTSSTSRSSRMARPSLAIHALMARASKSSNPSTTWPAWVESRRRWIMPTSFAVGTCQLFSANYGKTWSSNTEPRPGHGNTSACCNAWPCIQSHGLNMRSSWPASANIMPWTRSCSVYAATPTRLHRRQRQSIYPSVRPMSPGCKCPR
jgi:hypothetical protein